MTRHGSICTHSYFGFRCILGHERSVSAAQAPAPSAFVLVRPTVRGSAFNCMKLFLAICALSVFICGCASHQTRQDNFSSLHDLVSRTLADTGDCGPVTTNADGRRYFEVKPQPIGLSITVSEQRFFTQSEWNRCCVTGTNLLCEYVEMVKTNHAIDTNHPMDAEAMKLFNGLTNHFGLSELPEWHYHNIGVDVSIQDIDVAAEREDAEARKRYDQIVKLLKPYDRPN